MVHARSCAFCKAMYAPFARMKGLVRVALLDLDSAGPMPDIDAMAGRVPAFLLYVNGSTGVGGAPRLLAGAQSLQHLREFVVAGLSKAEPADPHLHQ